MTHTRKLESEWARSQIEAYVDGSLAGEDAARMRAALEKDRSLAAAVERARHVRSELRALPEPSAPRGLLWRLLVIPGAPRTPWLWATAPLMAGALAVGVVLWVAEPPAPPRDERAVAIQEFQVAMTYLQRTAEVTRDEVGGALLHGISEALTVGRDAMLDDESENGG